MVYGPQSDEDKVLFLQELRDIRDLHVGPWILAGDFNLIVDPSDLKALYLNGRRFTWSNEREHATLEKLDRVFASVDWESSYPDSFLSALSTATSDHSPLLLSLEAQLLRGRRFIFQSFWPKVDGFMDVVQESWNAGPAIGNPFKRVDVRLRAVAKRLQSWSDRFVGNTKQQILVATEVIFRFDVAMESRSLSTEERALRWALKKKLLGLASLERTMARQRSRLLWLKEGDACTRFFHLQASHRRRKNFISQLLVDGVVVSDHEAKAMAVDDFFSSLLGAAPHHGFTLDLEALGVPTCDLTSLEADFTEEEIWAVVKSMELDKAPGPVGFSGRFYVVCWDIIKQDVVDVFRAMARLDVRGMEAINRAFITLLPKRLDAKEVRDFRPVSLIHSMAKLFAKVVTTRVAAHLPRLVGPHQSAFVKGWCLHDNFMLVQGTGRRLHSARIDAVLLKLDITKAFDTVDWGFLLETLERRGFGPRFRSWICGLLSTATTRVLMNGIPGDPIDHRRGLRQGDPLSPMLFILVMDILHGLFEKAAAEGVLSRLAKRGFRHRTSIFADDVVTFLRPTRKDLLACSAIISDFGMASGLRTNFSKCSAHLIRCFQEQGELVASLFQCEVGSFPCTYLGLPLGVRKVTANQLNSVVDKVGSKVAAWKAPLLSKGGRLVLVKSTLAAIPVYSMMSMDLLGKVLKGVEKLCRGFLWKGRKEAHGGHCLVAWDKVCKPKELGGLGIPNLGYLNAALRVRWLWLDKVDDSKPWKEFAVTTTGLANDIFEAATSSRVGDGRGTLFWTDRWLDGCRIRDEFPSLAAVVRPRLLHTRTVRDGVHGAWLMDVGLDLGEEAISEFLVLWTRLQGFHLEENVEDSLVWNWSKDGVYSARSAYRNLFAGKTVEPLARQIWGSRAPGKCKFFAWLAANDRCWTADRLERRGLPHPSRCPLCDLEPETLAHLLLGCVFARQVWEVVLVAWNREGWRPSADADIRAWWAGITGLHGVAKDLRTAVTLVFWTIWRHRNDVVFNGASPEVHRVVACIWEEVVRWENAGLLRGGVAFSAALASGLLDAT